MLSIELVRSNPDAVREALERRGEHAPLEAIAALDAERRSLLTELEGLRAERNRVSREMGRMSERPAEMIEEMRRTGDRIRGLEERVKEVESGLEAELMALPNLPLPGVPDGADESANTVVGTWGTPRTYDFTPLPHWDLGERLGIIDLSRGAKLSGSRFFALSGAGARLQRALTAWMIDLHVQEHGYREVYVPYLVRRDTMYGSGNLPKFADNLYHDEEDDLWLIPTAEVPLTGFHGDEILEPGALPLYYVATRRPSAARRPRRARTREASSAFTSSTRWSCTSWSSLSRRVRELEMLLEDAQDVCRRLDIPYRVLRLCAGDMGFPSAESYDLEMWAPGCQEWLEVSSCSNCTDFQARTGQHTLQAPGGRKAAAGAHPERLGAGPPKGAHRYHGDLPAGRRLYQRAGRPQALHGA